MLRIWKRLQVTRPTWPLNCCCSGCTEQELKELVASYQTLREGGRGPAICSTIISTARQCNMEKDCSLPPDETDTKEMELDARDEIVGKVYQKCASVPRPRSCPCACPCVLLRLMVRLCAKDHCLMSRTTAFCYNCICDRHVLLVEHGHGA